MRIVYLNAQHLPTTETDSQQVVKTVSALAAEGADIELTVPYPLSWQRRKQQELEDEIRRYYSVQHPLSLRLIPTVMRTPGQIERGVAAIVAAVGLRRRTFDILYLRNYFCMLAAYAAGQRFVLESHRLLDRHYPNRARALLHMRAKKRIIGIVTNGEMITEYFHSLGFPRDHVLTAHNGFDLQDLEPVRAPEEARRKLGICLAKQIVFYGGHLQPHKGVDILIKLAQLTPEVTYLLAGGTRHDLTWFRRLMAPHDLRNIQLLGWKPPPEIVDYLYAADILIIPPSSAPFWDYGRTTYPMKLYSYLAVGRPIVAPNTPDIVEVIRDGETGLLVKPDCPQEAVGAIRRILRDAAFAKRIGEAAKADAQQFTWRCRARRILSYLEGLLSSPPASERAASG